MLRSIHNPLVTALQSIAYLDDHNTSATQIPWQEGKQPELVFINTDSFRLYMRLINWLDPATKWALPMPTALLQNQCTLHQCYSLNVINAVLSKTKLKR